MDFKSFFKVFFIAFCFDLCHGDFVEDKKCSSISLYTDDFFVVLANTESTCHPTVSALRNKECDILENNNGFLDSNSRVQVCKLSCKQYRTMCSLIKNVITNGEIEEGSFREDVKGFFYYVNALVTKTFDDYDPEVGFLEESFLESIEVNSFLYFFKRSLPILLTLVPLLLNQFEYYNVYYFIVGMIIIFPVYFLANFFSNVQLCYNLFMWVLCLVTDPGRNPLKPVIVSYVVLICSILFSLFHRGWMQYLSGMMVIIMYSCYIFKVFMSKDFSKGSSVAVFIAHIVMLTEQIGLLHNLLMLETFSFTVLRAFQNTVLPNGRYGYLFMNVFDIAYSMVKFIDPKYKVIAWVFSIIVQICFFFIIRCLFGTYVINALRFRVDFKSFVTGGVLYSSGVFSGLGYLFNVLCGDEKQNSKRFVYSIVSIFILWHEFFHAFDFIIIRLILWGSDTILWSSVYSKAPKYLHMNVDMRRIAFPQDCKSVWVSVDYMSSIGKFIKKMYVDIDGKQFSGLGFLSRHSDSDKASLISINHVGNCNSVTVDGCTYFKPEITTLSGSLDPIVAVELSPYTDKVCKSVNFITADEAHMIKQVIISSLPDGSDEPMMVYTNEFSVDKHGDIRVRSCLKEGDSGGPLFAALSNGAIRYIGATSRTTDDRCRGHKFSYVTTAKGVRHDSDDDSTDGRPVNNKAAIDFNRQRNPNNLSNICDGQNKLMSEVALFGTWVIDVGLENCAVWNSDRDIYGNYIVDEDNLPDDYEENKKNYEKKRKRRSKKVREKLKEISDKAEYVFSDPEERYDFMVMVNQLRKFNYKPGAVLSVVSGQLLIDGTPDPNDYANPHPTSKHRVRFA